MYEDEEPECTPLDTADNLLFIFILDRSGSMAGSRVETAKEALRVFLRSLPVGCSFALISFGSKMQMLQFNQSNYNNIYKYNDETSQEAINKID